MVESAPFPIPRIIRPAAFQEEGPDDALQGEKKTIRLLPSAMSLGQAGKRYSRLVRTLKLILPALALGLLATVIAWPQMQLKNARLSMGYSGNEAETDDPRMINARFTGIDVEGRPYSITAKRILQIGDSPETAQLDLPQADVTLKDGSWVALNATSGLFSDKTRILSLRGNVTLYHDSGYEFHSSLADIDLESMSASGSAPITGQGPFGHINAEGFLLTDSGKRVIFSGKTKLTLMPQSVR